VPLLVLAELPLLESPALVASVPLPVPAPPSVPVALLEPVSPSSPSSPPLQAESTKVRASTVVAPRTMK
jgi:hypothetical protein